jgi:AcrR family transcriptional regulator
MSLTRQDWVDAAWSALRKGGPDMVAVNPLAKQLGAARSSFYWHFRDRAELLQAALHEWEKERTDATITIVLEQPDPRERLRTLITMAFADSTEAGADITLTAHASDPIVGPVLARVIGRRIDFLCRCFEDLGFGAESRTRAVIAYSAFAGWLQLSYSVPDFATAALSQDASIAVTVNKLLLPPDKG